MIYVPTHFLKPGMVLAKDISAYGSMFALLVRGQTLTETLIRRLLDAGIGGAYVESAIANDIEPTEILEPTYKKKVISDLKGIFDDCERTNTLSKHALNHSMHIAEELVMSILNQDVFLVDVVTIKDYDNYTYSHCVYVAMLSVLIGVQLKYNQKQLNELALCGLMHDIGKVDIPLEIINKTSRLTEAEFEEIKTHPLRSIERLRHNQNLTQRVFNGISCHHEKYDGTGYPFGLKGDKIHIYARILALADVYDALTSDRSYRRAWMPAEAIEYMMAQSNIHFDHDLLQCFLHTVAAYPLGSVVSLSNGGIGIVIQNNPENTLRPKVRIIRNGGDLKKGDEIDLLTNKHYLSVVVSGTLGNNEIAQLPQELLIIKK